MLCPSRLFNALLYCISQSPFLNIHLQTIPRYAVGLTLFIYMKLPAVVNSCNISFVCSILLSLLQYPPLSPAISLCLQCPSLFCNIPLSLLRYPSISPAISLSLSLLQYLFVCSILLSSAISPPLSLSCNIPPCSSLP